MADESSGKKRRTRRSYTAEQRRKAVADVPSLGLCAAAHAHKMPPSTLHRWANSTDATSSRKAEEPEGAEPNAKEGSELDAQSPAKPRQQEKPLPPAKPQRPEKRRKSAKHYTPSQKAEILEHAAAHGVSAAEKKFEVSRWSIYDWKRKVERAAAGEGASPTTGPSAVEIEQQRDKEILDEHKRHPGLGPSQIKNQLRRKGVKVSVSTARRVMEEVGYRPPKVKREGHDQRFEAVRPNHLWHLDYLQRYINRASTHTLILLDDHSRYAVGHGVDEVERASLVISTFEEAVERHGRPEMVMHDKGSAFWSWRGISRFTALLTELGVDQITAEHKEWNGKLEVFNANLQKELFDVHRFYDVAEMRRRLAAHLHWYNHGRTSHALGGLLVPADRYYGLADQVLARIEAGGGRDTDPLDLRDRCLELFKVVSRNGHPEVWLMGQKLLGALEGPFPFEPKRR